MRLVFNELSLDDTPQNRDDGKKLIENFIKVYSCAVSGEFRFNREVYTSVDFNKIEIAKDYSIAEWRNNKNIDIDIKRKFKNICDKQIIIEPDDEIEMSFSHTDKKPIGALAAYINNHFLFSLSTNDFWKEFEIKGNVYSLNDDENKEVSLHNISTEEHLDGNTDVFKKAQKSSLDQYTTPEKLSEKLDEIFPYLIFHEEAKNQLKNKVEVSHLDAIKNKLYEINECFSSWDEGPFDNKKFESKISPQSQETLKKYKKEHTYEFEGEKILVSWHLRYTGGIAGRIYFYPYEKRRKAIICSLTVKLPTVSCKC